MLVLLLLLFVLVATVTDVARHRIYNWTTYPGILLGLAGQFWQSGWNGLQAGLLGFFVCGLIMLFCFVLFSIGGGDVKLIAMVGAFLGIHQGVEAMLWTFIIGSVFGMAMLIWNQGLAGILGGTLKHLRLVVQARGWLPLTEEERKPLKRWLFLAPAALVAVCIVTAPELRRLTGGGQLL